MTKKLPIIFLLLCGMLAAAGAQVFAGPTTVVDIPMNQQVGNNGIYVPSGLNGVISFQPANPPDDPDGFCRVNFASGWYYAYIDFDNAGIPRVNMNDPLKLFKMELDCRYFQGNGNTNPYGDAPIFLRLYSYDDAGKTIGGYRDYGIFYATQSAGNTAAGQVGLDPRYPAWSQESVPLNSSGLWTYSEGGIGGGSFNPSNVCRLRFYGTDWSGTGNDYVDLKNFKITYNFVPATLSGTVRDSAGNPVPGAIVGIKTSPQATADAQVYVRTDGKGRYSRLLEGGTYYVAAWAYGYLAGPDTVVTMEGVDNTADVTISKAGANIAKGATATATNSDPANGPGNAVNGAYGDRWITNNPLADTEQDQTYTIDFGSIKDVAGVTIWWENAFPSNYTVDVTAGDPVSGPWTSIYTVTGATGGYDTTYGQHIDPIHLASPVQARAIRFHATKFGGFPVYSAWEFVVNGTAADPNVYTRISDLKGLPDGTPVDIWKEVSASGVTAAGTSTIYPDYFWYEEYDRTAGIKVHRAGHGAWPGELDRTVGVMATDPDTNERYIEATQDIEYLGAVNSTFEPLSVTNKTAAADKNTTGLIVTTWGKVTDVDADRNWFKIDDGSGTPVKVYRPATRADQGAFVTVTGVLSAEPAIYEPVIAGMINTWLFNGSYSVADPSGTGDWTTWQQANLDEDFLASVGGEANIVPKPGDAAPKGTWFVWSSANGRFNLGGMPFQTSGQNQRAEYASVWFYSPGTYTYSADQLTAWVASDDGYKLWVNGVVAGQNNVWRAAPWDTPDELQAGDPWGGGDLWTIQPGWNHVLIKITDITGGHEFGVKFTVVDSTGNVVPLSLPPFVSSW